MFLLRCLEMHFNLMVYKVILWYISHFQNIWKHKRFFFLNCCILFYSWRKSIRVVNLRMFRKYESDYIISNVNNLFFERVAVVKLFQLSLARTKKKSARTAWAKAGIRSLAVPVNRRQNKEDLVQILL